jgi:hypothetical protein
MGHFFILFLSDVLAQKNAMKVGINKSVAALSIGEVLFEHPDEHLMAASAPTMANMK